MPATTNRLTLEARTMEADRTQSPEAFDVDCYRAHQRYIAACQSLRELLELLPEATRLDSTSLSETMQAATKNLTPSQRHLANRNVLSMFRESANELNTPDSDASETVGAERLSEELSEATRSIEKQRPRSTPTPADFEVAIAVSEMASTLYMRRFRVPLRQILVRAIITELVASFEQLLGRLHAAFYRSHPEALGSDKEFSLADLKAFGGVEAAIDDAISNRVDSFLRQDFAEWQNWFRNYLKLSFDDFLPDRPAIAEVIERRNIVVHSDSRVSRQYRTNVGKDSAPIGTPLLIDEDYVRGAIDKFVVFGASLGAAAWQKIGASESSRARSNRHLHHLNLSLMLLGRWAAVERLSEISGRHVAVKDSDRLIYQINHWLAVKRLRSLSEVREAVEAFDVTAANVRFVIAKAALLDDVGTVAKLLPKAIDANDMAWTHIHEWPLLEEFRESPHYLTLISSQDLESNGKPAPPTPKTARRAPVATRPPREAKAARVTGAANASE